MPNVHEAHLHTMVGWMKKARVLVLGDPMLDVYHYGHVTRISQEAPVPVFAQHAQEIREGGACNVLKNLRALGAAADASFPLGEWTKKHRYVVGRQQIFRHDEDIDHESAHLSTELKELIAWAQVIILSDYGRGTIGEEFCEAIMDCGLPVVVDPRGGDWDKYSDATVICPNADEYKAHIAIRTHTQPVFPYTLLKLGERGMCLLEGKSPHEPLWRSNTRAREVFDVTGAGDTVIAAFAAALCTRGEYPIKFCAELANMAAGVVVGKEGTATCSAEELHREIDRG